MTDQQQPLADLRAALANVGRAMAKALEPYVAQTAMGRAYVGEEKELARTLKGVSHEQLAKIAAAGEMVADFCDLEEARRQRGRLSER